MWWCEARACCPFAMVVGMEWVGATGGASKASDRCSFTKISENNKDWCNGRGKPTPLRKASGIVQKQNRISTHRRLQYEKRVV